MRIDCIVDNTVSRQSSFWGEHGLAFFIEQDEKRFLFDTGGSGEVLSHNLKQAGIAPDSLALAALSHNHRDHTGGLEWLLEAANGIPVYVHPEALQPHFSDRTGMMLEKGIPFDVGNLDPAQWHLNEAAVEILPGVFLSGEIQPRPHPEGRSPHHFIKGESGFVPDPYRDDQSLVMESSKGPILICGCCHTGLLNTLDWVEARFGQPPRAILGGLHLASAGQEQVEALVDALRSRGAPHLYPNHCTGETALMMLMQAFPDRVQPFSAGNSLILE